MKIWILFSRGKNNILLTIVLPLENKIHIFAPPCNILYLSNSWLFTATRGEPEGAGITINRGKVVFFQTGTEPSYIMYTYFVMYKKKINPQTEINTRRAFLDTIVFALLFLQKYMILLYYK